MFGRSVSPRNSDDDSASSYHQIDDVGPRAQSPPVPRSTSWRTSNPMSPSNNYSVLGTTGRAIYGRTQPSSPRSSRGTSPTQAYSGGGQHSGHSFGHQSLLSTHVDDEDPLDENGLEPERSKSIPMTAFSHGSSSAAALSPSTSFTNTNNAGTNTSTSNLTTKATDEMKSLSVSDYKPRLLNSDDDDDPHLDLDELEDEEALLGEQSPLLKEYQSSTSTIRKDYTTVDWYFTKHNLGRIRRMIRLTNKAMGWKGKAMNAFIAAQGWIILFFTGVATAASASFIHLLCEWLIDIKEGLCVTHSVFTTRRVCCMDAIDADSCGWETWGSMMLGRDSADTASAYWLNFFLYIFWALPMALAASWFVNLYSKAAARSGLSEMKVMLGGFIIKKFLGIRTVMIKALGVILGVSSGLAIGKLGPLIHIACCWGNIFARRFTKYNTNEVKKREIFSASVAAGVSAAFGSPIGGVLFSLESLSSYFPPQTMWRSFWCSITAAVVLGYIDPFQTGKLVQFGVTSNANQWSMQELPLFALIGCAGGLVGALFNKVNLRVNQYRKRNKWLRFHPVKEVGILCLLTCIVSFPNIYLRGSSAALLAQLFTNCRDLSQLSGGFDSSPESAQYALCGDENGNQGNVGLFMALLVIAAVTKFIFTALTYGCNVPSGVFMPGLVIGAAMGRMVGWSLELSYAQDASGFFSHCVDKTYCISPGLYAIIGAAAVLTGITRLTVSLAIVIYEVTGGLEYIAPIMITIVCAKWSADWLGKQGFYSLRISQLHGYPWIDAYAEMELIGPAMDVMTIKPICLTVYGMSLNGIKQLLMTHPYHGFPIIDNANELMIYGYIARSDLELLIEANDEMAARNPFLPCHFSADPPPYPCPNFFDFSASVDKYPVKVLPHTPIDRVVGLFQGLGLRYVLVNSHKGQLMGIIKKKDVLTYIANLKQGQAV